MHYCSILEQYCIGAWNVRSMNQGKLEVVKQEMARANINILGISELKWTGMGEFSSDDHYIYYCGQESLRRNEVAIIINKRVQNAVLGCNLRNNRIIMVHLQGKPFHMRVSQVWCCKEQYCIGIWNVWSTNQGKLDVVKQEMARVNINILGISELKWTGMGGFNPDDHFKHINC